MIDNLQIVWHGFVSDSTGYARASRDYILALDRLGFDIKIMPLVQERLKGYAFEVHDKAQEARIVELVKKPIAFNKVKVMVYHAQPNGLDVEEARKIYKHIIINTVWETTRIPDNWIATANKVDAILVPSLQNIEAFKNSGVTTPIFLAPHGSDIVKFNPNNNPLPIMDIKDKFVFSSVFGWQHRKAPDVLLKAFWQEFKSNEPVCLVLKTKIGESKEAQRRAIAQLAKWKLVNGFSNDTAEVIMSVGDFAEEDIQSLYTSSDVFVLPSRGEGVGLPYIEALSSGIPVISTNWGGQMDFLNSGNSFLVDYELSACTSTMDDAIATPYDDLFTSNMEWAEPNIQSLMSQMRHAYENQDEVKSKGRKGRLDMENMTWDMSVIKIKDVIESIIGR